MRDENELIAEWNAAKAWMLALGVLAGAVVGSCMAVVHVVSR